MSNLKCLITMSYNFTYPNNSSSWIVTIAIGVVISILTFILLYNNTQSNFNWTEQSTASAQVDESDLGCEASEEETPAVEQPYKPTTTSSSSSSSSSSQQQPASASQQEPAATAHQQPAAAASQQPAASDSRTYNTNQIDEKPVFPGGQANLHTWLSNNLHYPAPALEDGIEGTVKVQFTVFKDGHVGDARVVQSVESHLDAEALRLVKSMPNWTPGKVNGQPVNVTYTIPIKFVM